MSGGQQKHARLLADSPLFDRDWYLSQYPDVAGAGLDPIEHYLHWGARMGRDPGPGFNTRYYLDGNPDVRASGMNPLAHYLLYGFRERRAPLPVPPQGGEFRLGVDVVIPVHNAFAHLKKCVASVLRHSDGLLERLIIVNDASDEQVGRWLRRLSHDHRQVLLVENGTNLGYTRSVNIGLRQSSSAYVLTLNSDTIVTDGWLRGMFRCMCSEPGIGIVGPLSNAASWQNVPALYREDGHFAVNDIADRSVDEVARVVSAVSMRRYPRVPFVNGFCFMIDRRVMNAIGLMDEENFPVGYGEENDYCIRAADAGFRLAVADDVYVHHAKSSSFGHERRRELSRDGMLMLRGKHGEKKVARLLRAAKRTGELDLVRRDVAQGLANPAAAVHVVDFTALRILFLLPVKGGGGGAHSVVQEASEMRRMNVDVKIAVEKGRVQDFIDQYPEVEDAGDLFIDFSSSSVFDVAAEFDIVVGTIYRSMETVEEIVRRHPQIMPAYYVQDYEPLFYSRGSSRWVKATESYGRVPNTLLFAKTAWIAGQVKKEHGLDVERVAASLDHDVYFPGSGKLPGPFRMAAMIRPETPRRGAERTMRVLRRLHDRFGDGIVIDLFGCEPTDPSFEACERSFRFSHHGVLKRHGVADLLRQADLFVDLSDYQAFGRTALEAMACGCVSAITMHGGADEYAIDAVNALLVDSLDEDACLDRISAYIQAPAEHGRYRLEALATASRYSMKRAAISELAMFAKEFGRQQRTVQERARHMDGPSAENGQDRIDFGIGTAVVGEATPHVMPTSNPDTVAALDASNRRDLAMLRAALDTRYREIERLTRIVIDREKALAKAQAIAAELRKLNTNLSAKMTKAGRDLEFARNAARKTLGAGRIAPALPAGKALVAPADRPGPDDVSLLCNSEWFDAAWYVRTYADARVDAAPEVDYLRNGVAAGRNPGPSFDTAYYLRRNPDVAASGMNPLVHFLRHGLMEGRRPASSHKDAKNG